jgi:PIN domain nuclease of toxin-antitoxin system
VNLLLDTHTALWFWWNDPQLSATALAVICDPANRKLVSPASAWEVAIKVSLKKLDIGGPYRGFFPQHMLRNNFYGC